ncbi:serine/threonine-protein kinase [Geodermatophilus sp. CPCC 206100]|uniref:serine/threonine-protein kinase n=1 Tax=Geodermatophilus sp. CPCC 206100 TaxID=3020054 RepID=UPI003B00F357
MSGPDHLVAGRYRLHARVGGGGMGTVWRATDEVLGRRVAVKQVLPPSGADPTAVEQQRQRALREGRIAARLSHPHAISVYDVAVDEAGSPWLVMEYLPSRSLAEVLAEDGVLHVDQVAQIGAQVADALVATHAAGIVHRDVKPANVLIGEGAGVDGLVKITDFGISHATGDVTLTQTGQITGTPAFLAPEVAQGSEMTPESDVFSLGATLYTCLEGEPPFGMDDNALRLLHRVAGGQVAPPRRAGSMSGALTRMLAVDPAARPSMSEVRDELARLAAGRDGDPTTVLMARTILRSSTNRQRTAELGAGEIPAGGGSGGGAGPRTAVQDVPPAQPSPPTPPPTPPPARPASIVTARPRKRRPGLVAAVVLAVLLVAGGIAWLVTRGDAPEGASAADPPASSAAPSSEADGGSAGADPGTEPAPSSDATAPPADQPADEPADEPAEDAPPPDDPDAVAEQTLARYYELLPGDPDAAYAMTGPTLKSAASPGYYRDFWSPWSEVELAELRDVSRQDDGSVTATTEVRYTGRDGGSQVELHEVRFVRADDGDWLVDFDRYVGPVG